MPSAPARTLIAGDPPPSPRDCRAPTLMGHAQTHISSGAGSAGAGHMPDENSERSDLPVHDGGTPPEDQVQGMATPEDLTGDQPGQDGGDA